MFCPKESINCCFSATCAGTGTFIPGVFFGFRIVFGVGCYCEFWLGCYALGMLLKSKTTDCFWTIIMWFYLISVKLLFSGEALFPLDGALDELLKLYVFFLDYGLLTKLPCNLFYALLLPALLTPNVASIPSTGIKPELEGATEEVFWMICWRCYDYCCCVYCFYYFSIKSIFYSN